MSLRDWSLITGRRGYKTGGGGGRHVKFYPYRKAGGGCRTSFSHAEGGGGGGHNNFLGSFYAIALSFSHIEGQGAKSVHSLKGGARKVLPCQSVLTDP